MCNVAGQSNMSESKLRQREAAYGMKPSVYAAEQRRSLSIRQNEDSAGQVLGLSPDLQTSGVQLSASTKNC